MVDQSAEEMVRCVVCQEDIRRGSKLCKHCKSAQDFTRVLARLSTVTAAVLSVGSLVTAAYSLWKLVPSPAKIEAIALSCQKDSVKLALVNVGDKTGVVRSVDLQIESATAKPGQISLSPERFDEKLIIEPGKSGTVDYSYRVSNSPVPFPFAPGAGTCRYVFSIGAVDFSGKTAPSKAECECPRS